MLKVRGLNHGGIMVNYQCNAACRHCLYACSPDRNNDYISKKTAEEICKLLVLGGCRSVHIGGGEPFLDFDGLITLTKTIRSAGITIDYVETNGFWAADKKQAQSYLEALSDAGADNLCIALDPFHAEYIPFGLPLSLAEICRANNFDYFLWQERFLRCLAHISPTKAHSREALEDQISPGYILETARRYGLSMGGRAINIENEFTDAVPVAELLKTSTKTCRHLLSTDHFHVDLYGKFIPPGCTGIALPFEEVIKGFPHEKYPVYEALLTEGIAGLINFAAKNGFKLEEEYTSNCALCFYIRKWLCENSSYPELVPEHYDASLTYY